MLNISIRSWPGGVKNQPAVFTLCFPGGVHGEDGSQVQDWVG